LLSNVVPVTVASAPSLRSMLMPPPPPAAEFPDTVVPVTVMVSPE